MIKKIPEETLPATWRPDLVKFLCFPPVVLEWMPPQSATELWDAMLCVRPTETASARFAMFYQRDATPRQIVFAATRSAQLARKANLLPLLLVPYLSEERLLELEALKVSGLDMCGNGILMAPGTFTFFRSGYPNRFTSSRPLKNVYRGVSSLTARAFLLQPTYTEVGELQQEIQRRGGTISLPTISKALRELEEDQVIRRVRQVECPQARTLTLLQPDKLLTRLEENYAAPRIRNTFLGKVDLEARVLQEALQANAQRSGVRLIATGIGSATRYASLAMENTISLNTDGLESLLQNLPAISTSRFPNLSIQETDDPTVFFDPRTDEGGFPWASPLTAYLEMAHGEPRLAQTAVQIRERLLGERKENDA